MSTFIIAVITIFAWLSLAGVIVALNRIADVLERIERRITE